MNIHLRFKKGTRTTVLGGEVLNFMHPLREWFIGLMLATFIFVGGVIYIAYDFYDQFGISDEVVTVEGQTVLYQEADVVYYAKLYDVRDSVFQELRAKRILIPTPVTTVQEEEEVVLDLPLVNE